MSDIFDQLTLLLQERREADPKKSYVAGLYAAGLDQILKKVGEESAETLIAAKSLDRPTGQQDLIYESADLLFHLMVLLVSVDIPPQEVLLELERRFCLSGLEEKAARTKK